MNLQAVVESVNGTQITGKSGSTLEFENAFASDLMSDVLTIDVHKTLLITGLANLQTIRTAEMSDIECIIIARNKKINQEMIDLASKNNLIVIESPFSVFKISGILYQKGINPLY